LTRPVEIVGMHEIEERGLEKLLVFISQRLCETRIGTLPIAIEACQPSDIERYLEPAGALLFGEACLCGVVAHEAPMVKNANSLVR
jgi:hypothetical protein